MASGALPPGFPPVEIDGECYWDGGIVSNSPLWYVLDRTSRMSALILQVDLFSGQGRVPTNLDQVLERAKDIQFRARRALTHQVRQIEACAARWRRAAQDCRRIRDRSQVSKLDEVSRRERAVADAPDQPARHEVVRVSRTTSSRGRLCASIGRRDSKTYDARAHHPDTGPTPPRSRTAYASSTWLSESQPLTGARTMTEDEVRSARLRDAAHEPGVSAGTVSFRESRVLHRHLPHRSGSVGP